MNRRGTADLMRWAVAVSFCCTASAQGLPPSPWNVTPVGQIGGHCRAVDVAGQYAYVGEGSSLVVLDVLDPSSPVLVGHLALDGFQVNDILVEGGFAYLTGSQFRADWGLQIVDVVDPRSPHPVSFYATQVAPQGVYVTDSLAYIASGYYDEGGFQILDVSDPTSPTLRGPFTTLSSYASTIYISNGIAYLAAYNGLHIIDVTNPSLPIPFGFFSQNECNDVFVLGGLAYTGTYNGLEIVDVTSPSAPTRLGRSSNTQQTLGVAVSDGLAFLAQWSIGMQLPSGLRIIDVTDPSSPSLVGFCATPGWASDVAISSSTAYLADWGGGLSIIDVSTPSSPTLDSFYETLSDAMDVWVEGGVAYVANGVRGLKTIDVSNPRSPKVLGSLPTSVPAYKITVSGNRAYLAFSLGSLYIVDVTTPTMPVLLGSYNAPDVSDIAVADGLAYIASIGELQIVDVANPSSPTLRGSFPTPGWELDVCVSGDLAYIADYSSLQIIDVSNPSEPVFRSSYPGARLSDVFVSNGIAYISGGTPDFACIDVTDPDASRLLGSYALSGWIYQTEGLHVCDGLAYVFMDGIRVLDVSDPTRPTLVGHYPTARSSFFWGDIFASGNLVYSADEYGLRIFQFTDGDAAAKGCWRLYK